jgi:hypothetical protein
VVVIVIGHLAENQARIAGTVDLPETLASRRVHSPDVPRPRRPRRLNTVRRSSADPPKPNHTAGSTPLTFWERARS